MNLFLLQKGLSEGVVRSQMITLIKKLNLVENQNYLMIEKSEYQKYSHDFDAVISYDNYLDKIKKLKDIKLIYVRSYTIFIQLYILRFFSKLNYKLLFDFRGLGSAETFARHNSYAKEWVLLQLEKFVYKRADYVHCVSHVLKSFLLNRFGKKNIKVIPCCVNKRFKRKRIVSQNTINFVYVGGHSFWQKTDEIMNLYSSIEKMLPNSTLTIITQDELTFRESLKNKSINRFTIKSMAQEEVLSDLINYDFGFLLRDDITMNNVSSPIKFAEYISRGIIPIISHGIGDYSSIVDINDLGIITDGGQISIDEINMKLNDGMLPDRLYEASKSCSWDHYIDDYFLHSVSDNLSKKYYE
jgi:hypothetical protein